MCFLKMFFYSAFITYLYLCEIVKLRHGPNYLMYGYSCGATPLCEAFVWEMEKEVTWDGIEEKKSIWSAARATTIPALEMEILKMKPLK